MREKKNRFLMLLLLVFIGIAAGVPWGFYGHRKINRMASFTLPQDMFGFYKKYIEYITDHAVDPDKRRYATKLEAIRHYIDIDHWGEAPFDNVPKDLNVAIAKHMKIKALTPAGDSIFLMDINDFDIDSTMQNRACTVDFYGLSAWLRFYLRVGQLINTEMIHEVKDVPWLTVQEKLPADSKIILEDCFSGYGIAPYYIRHMMKQLTNAFRYQDGKRVLRLSAEMGHYIGDIHVPLHTTENYNGEMTDQVGIHAFWETRLPELYADKNYDFMVGRAEYIKDEREFFWNIVYESHSLLRDVLDIEKNLSKEYPNDQQYCYEERNYKTVWTECEEYARAYHDAMNGMVERRMQDAILALGSAWYTCWVNAGQPNLGNLTEDILWTEEEEKERLEIEKKYQDGKVIGREHGK